MTEIAEAVADMSGECMGTVIRQMMEERMNTISQLRLEVIQLQHLLEADCLQGR